MRAAGRAGKGRGGTWQLHPRFWGTSELGQEGALNNRSPGLGWEGAHEERQDVGKGLRCPLGRGRGAPSEGRAGEGEADGGSTSLT